MLFIDEVHRFSRTQQDSLLGAVEDRTIVLIAATTENPFFSVVSPLLSRSLVLQLQPLTDADIGALVDRAVDRRARTWPERSPSPTRPARTWSRWPAATPGGR